MAVDYCQRKAAKKQRRRLNDGKKKTGNADGAAGGEGGASGKDKKSRPKRGRSGPRRLCKGMCFQVPKILDDDITWRSNDDDGERGAKVYDPRAPPPPREAERAAAAAARLLESGAAEARVLLEREGGGGGGGGGADASGESSGKRKRNRKKDTGTKVEAPATPSRRGGAGASAPAPAAAVAAAVAAAAAAPPRFSTGAGIDFAGAPPSSSSSPALSSHPTLDRSFDLSTLPLSLRMLAAACGLEAPTKVQSSAWALATEEGEQEGEGGNKKGERKEKGNRNLLIVAPPGAGKTLAYLLPAAAKVVVESEEDGSGDDDDDSEDDGDDGGVGRRRKRAKKASSSSRSASLRLPSPRVLVLVPTRELARQVAAAARPLRRAAGLKVVRVAGGDRREDQVDRLRASSRGKGGSSKSSSVHVLVATPGRLLDLVRGGDVGLGSIRTVVLDEADKMLSSAGIAEQLAEIRQALPEGGGQASSPSLSSPSPSSSQLQCMLVSATMPASVSRLAAVWLGEGFASVGEGGGGGGGGGGGEGEGTPAARLQAANSFLSSPSSSGVTQVVTVCAEHKKPVKLLKHLSRARDAASAAGERHAPRVLIFANRIKTVQFVADFLRAQERKQLEEKRKAAERAANKSGKGPGGGGSSKGSRNNSSSPPSASRTSSKIETLHGDRTQPERDAALAAFRAGKATVLVATDVAARGLDVSGLRHVVNYDFPSNLESYEHRVGRAGRDGKGGHVSSFFGRPLAPLARGVVAFLQEHGQGVDPNLVRLAEAYEVAKERMMKGELLGEAMAEEGEMTKEGEQEGEGEEKDRERLRRSVAAKAAAAESKRGCGAGKQRKRRAHGDDDHAAAAPLRGDEDASDDERAAPPVLGLYRKASGAGAKTSAAAKTSTAAKTASAEKNKREKRKAVPGRLRQKLRRDKEMRGG